MMLQLVNLYKTYDANGLSARAALAGLSLVLKKGDFTTLIGSNGAGKSSLLKAISGELVLDKGKIMINNHINITHFNTPQRARWISRVFQDAAQGTIAYMSLAENLSLSYMRGRAARFTISPDKKTRDYFKERLAVLNMGLENRLDEQVGGLSGGQRQALALIMATLTPPDLLLLDEHCSALDPKSAQQVMRITAEVVQALGVTTLMVTHNMRDALHYGNRLIMLHQGKVLHDYNQAQKARLNVDIIHDFFDIL